MKLKAVRSIRSFRHSAAIAVAVLSVLAGATVAGAQGCYTLSPLPEGKNFRRAVNSTVFALFDSGLQGEVAYYPPTQRTVVPPYRPNSTGAISAASSDGNSLLAYDCRGGQCEWFIYNTTTDTRRRFVPLWGAQEQRIVYNNGSFFAYNSRRSDGTVRPVVAQMSSDGTTRAFHNTPFPRSEPGRGNIVQLVAEGDKVKALVITGQNRYAIVSPTASPVEGVLPGPYPEVMPLLVGFSDSLVALVRQGGEVTFAASRNGAMQPIEGARFVVPYLDPSGAVLRAGLTPYTAYAPAPGGNVVLNLTNPRNPGVTKVSPGLLCPGSPDVARLELLEEAGGTLAVNLGWVHSLLTPQ